MEIDDTEDLRYIRAQGGTWVPAFEQQGMVGAHYDIDTDLSWYQGTDMDWLRLRQLVLEHSKAAAKSGSLGTAGVQGGSLAAIIQGYSDGDVVLVPCPDGDLMVGRISGPYRFVPVAGYMRHARHPESMIATAPPHQRPVRWIGRLPYDNCPRARTLTSWLTAFTISAARQPELHSELVRALREHVHAAGAPQPQPQPHADEAAALRAQRDQLAAELLELKARFDGLQRMIDSWSDTA